jgi:hypothetical protein
MPKSKESSGRRRKLLNEIQRLAEVAVFGTLSETYRTCGRAGCYCHRGGSKHGPHLNVSYRGEKGKTTGYYVPQAAEAATREGVAAWEFSSCRMLPVDGTTWIPSRAGPQRSSPVADDFLMRVADEILATGPAWLNRRGPPARSSAVLPRVCAAAGQASSPNSNSGTVLAANLLVG